MENDMLQSSANKPILLSELSKSPLISVIVANYNYDQYIGAAIESILAQTYTNYELVICDDGSTDLSVSVVNKYISNDQRIKLIKKNNGGQASALNEAYKNSQGQIICILDADDTFTPNKLDLTRKWFIENPISGMFVHKVVQIDAYGRIISGPKPDYLFDGWGREKALQNGGKLSLPPASGVSLRRDVCDILFPIPEYYRSNADGYILSLGPLITPIIKNDNVLSFFRIHGANLSSNFNKFPTADLLRKTYVNTKRMNVDVKEYLQRTNQSRNGYPRMEDNHDFIGHSLALYVLVGEFLDKDVIGNVHVLLTKVKNKKTRALWKILIMLPRPIAVELLRFWWGTGKIKRFIGVIKIALNGK
jgi:glycosyltransferase involved in cell wall biosynthesis